MNKEKEFKSDPSYEVVKTISNVNDVDNYIFINMSKDNENKEFGFAYLGPTMLLELLNDQPIIKIR